MTIPALEALFDDRVTRCAWGTRLEGLPAHGGVYALTDGVGGVVQLAAGQNLRRAVGVRLQARASGDRRADLSEVVHHVWWAAAHSRFETTLRFHAIARKLYPRDYGRMCAFGPAWFAVIDEAEHLPRWRVSNDPAAGTSACVGPFCVRSRCDEFVKRLEDLHSLCRYHHVLDRTPHGEACAYFEMGRCPAPCDGSVPVAAYVQAVQRSLAHVLDGGRAHARQLAVEMAAAARDLAFERAARLREDLANAQAVERTLRGTLRRYRDFRFLVVQRGGGRTWLKAFFVDRGHIEASQSVRLRNLDQAAGQWSERLQQSAPRAAAADAVLRRERVWLVSHFLDRAPTMPGLFLHHRDVPEPAALACRIRQAFEARRR